jgi:predicted Zn-dependent protease
MDRRGVLRLGCAHCALLAARAFAADPSADWVDPPRITAPDPASDEGGLWAILDRAERKLRRGEFLIRDQALHDYVHAIACSLASAHCPDIRVYVVRTPWFNATMAANGMLQVWSGLLLRVENEAQLAAVLGHEIGHYLRRHSLEHLRDAKSRSAWASLLAPLGAGALGSLAVSLSLFSFSRDQEREADSIGLTLMRRAGYDPRQASVVWSNMLAEATARPGSDATKTSPMFATHPAMAERQETLARLAGSGAGVTREEQLARHLDPLIRDFLDDELNRAEYDQSILLFDRMVRRSPQRPDLLYYRAESHRLRGQPGDPESAFSDLQAAAAMPAPPAEVHRALGYVYLARGDRAMARASFASYLEAKPGAVDEGIIRNKLKELES